MLHTNRQNHMHVIWGPQHAARQIGPNKPTQENQYLFSSFWWLANHLAKLDSSWHWCYQSMQSSVLIAGPDAGVTVTFNEMENEMSISEWEPEQVTRVSVNRVSSDPAGVSFSYREETFRVKLWKQGEITLVTFIEVDCPSRNRHLIRKHRQKLPLCAVF